MQLFNNNYHVLGVFVDLKKAFDTVWHDTLLRKSCSYGVRGLPLSWFRSYLEDRRQLVRVGDIYSDTGNLVCGVPQGSVHGPIFFSFVILMIYPIYLCLPISHCLLMTPLYVSARLNTGF